LRVVDDPPPGPVEGSRAEAATFFRSAKAVVVEVAAGIFAVPTSSLRSALGAAHPEWDVGLGN
jgi:hypothetical protein